MNTPHLLSLATLHDAAPGILDVIFGPDGAFEGAPEWRCPIWDSEDGLGGDWMAISRYALHPLAEQFDPLNTMFFDLRIPSASARMAGLCAAALGESGEGWRVVRVGMTWTLTDGLSQMFYWDVLGNPRESTPPHLPRVGGRPFMSRPNFLAALTLALAPQIAALKGSP